MSDPVQIVLDGPDALRRAVKAISKAAPIYWARKKPLRVEITHYEEHNTNAQKRFWNGPMLTAIARQARWDGKQFPKEFWKEYYRRRFLLRDEFRTPDGEILQRYWSTADKAFTVQMMAEFLDRVQYEAITDWGVDFDV